MKNTLGDLNNHLFLQLERLNDEDLKDEELEKEIDRSKAISQIASNIISNAHVVVKAQGIANNSMNADAKIPKMLEG